MLKLSDIRLTHQFGAEGLLQYAASMLGISEAAVKSLQIQKMSIDARRKPDVRFVYTLLVSIDDEQGVLSRKIPNVALYSPSKRYEFPVFEGPMTDTPPIIVGTGPAGLFAALCLAESGVKCIILERGQPVEKRTGDVDRFWRGGGLDTSSNVQFGEGGAGTFSDGKLTTGKNDGRIGFVLERLVSFGAPEEILYQAKPHIGTDKLRIVVRSIRDRLIALGCDIRFGHRLADIEVSGGALRGVTVDNDGSLYSLSADKLLLAPGNSARDTFEMLSMHRVILTPKDFSIGVRIEHLQKDIDFAQYKKAADTRGVRFPASDYKLVSHLGDNRSVYTFCVCPGGQVVAAASEMGGVVTNGMSLFAHDSENCNGALLVNVTPDDFGHGPLDGIGFQRSIERAAFVAGGSDYSAPAQLVGDFLSRRASNGHGKITPSYLPGVRFCNLWDVLPEFVCDALSAAFSDFQKRIDGFACPDAVLTAVETRSSSPVRILREDFETVGIRGIFPCGEGAGYAGGIMSAAVDGIKCAEAIMNRLSLR